VESSSVSAGILGGSGELRLGEGRGSTKERIKLSENGPISVSRWKKRKIDCRINLREYVEEKMWGREKGETQVA